MIDIKVDQELMVTLGEYKIFSSESQRINAMKVLCGNVGVISQEAIDKLQSQGFFTAPASTKYHGSYAGGLFDHSYAVATTLLNMTERLNLQWENPMSPVRIGLLHDLCKIDQYKYNISTDAYEYVDNMLVTGHGIKSVVLAQKLPGIFLTEEEIVCILYHMGAFTDKTEWAHYTNAVHTYPNVLWTHTADMYASHYLEVKE